MSLYIFEWYLLDVYGMIIVVITHKTTNYEFAILSKEMAIDSHAAFSIEHCVGGSIA